MRPFRAAFSQNSGFTLPELLVVLSVGTIVVGLGMTMFLFTNKMFARWHEKADLEDAGERILTRFTTDIGLARSARLDNDSALVLDGGEGKKPVLYRLFQHEITRNGVSVSGPGAGWEATLKVVEVSTPEILKRGKQLFKAQVQLSRRTDRYEATTLATTRSSGEERWLNTALR